MSESFTVLPADAFSAEPFHLIGKDWMLVTSANPGDSLRGGIDYNTMTASWGGIGVLWNKPVAFVFIRPQRHTFAFIEANDRLTLSFFGEEWRRALSFCGSKSGRDYDKAKECGLTPVSDTTDAGRAVWFEEAKTVLKCRRLYGEFLSGAAFTDPIGKEVYPEADYHKMYVCEIEEILVR